MDKRYECWSSANRHYSYSMNGLLSTAAELHEQAVLFTEIIGKNMNTASLLIICEYSSHCDVFHIHVLN